MEHFTTYVCDKRHAPVIGKSCGYVERKKKVNAKRKKTRHGRRTVGFWRQGPWPGGRARTSVFEPTISCTQSRNVNHYTMTPMKHRLRTCGPIVWIFYDALITLHAHETSVYRLVIHANGNQKLMDSPLKILSLRLLYVLSRKF